MESDLHVTLIGCSGPAEGAWDWDHSAEEVTIDVSEGSSPETLVIDFRGVFSTMPDDGSTREQEIVGSVEYDATQSVE